MKETITLSLFTDAFYATRPENFSYLGLCALYDYLIELEEDCGTELELDVIGLCCDFSEVDKDDHYNNYDSEEEAEELICREINRDRLIVREG